MYRIALQQNYQQSVEFQVLSLRVVYSLAEVGVRMESSCDDIP